ncbi:MAG: segregation/condensation protein A [Eubacteriaceae bacterium]
MDKYSINTKNFEGPLDLLLFLINKNEVDIYDIPIVEITRQYMDYIYARQSMDLNVATEFIIMAAQLLEIKSKMLLPVDAEEQEEEDPREELAKRLYEYKIFKEISSYLAKGQESYFHTFIKDPMYVKTIFVEPENIDIDLDILSSIMKRYLAESKILADRLENYEKLQSEKVTVYEKISEIKTALAYSGNLSFLKILSQQKNITHGITLFLAMLEMMKQNLINLKQEKNFDDIIIGINSGEQIG